VYLYTDTNTPTLEQLTSGTPLAYQDVFGYLIFDKAISHISIQENSLTRSFKSACSGGLYVDINSLTSVLSPSASMLTASINELTAASLEKLFTAILDDIENHAGVQNREIAVTGTGNAIPNAATLEIIGILTNDYGCEISVNS